MFDMLHRQRGEELPLKTTHHDLLFQNRRGGCGTNDILFDRAATDSNSSDNRIVVLEWKTPTKNNDPSPVSIANPKKGSTWLG